MLFVGSFGIFLLFFVAKKGEPKITCKTHKTCKNSKKHVRNIYAKQTKVKLLYRHFNLKFENSLMSYNPKKPSNKINVSKILKKIQKFQIFLNNSHKKHQFHALNGWYVEHLHNYHNFQISNSNGTLCEFLMPSKTSYDNTLFYGRTFHWNWVISFIVK